MRLLGLCNGLLSLGLLSGLLATSGCGGDYGLFDISVHFESNVAADRDAVELCKLTVTDDAGRVLLKNFVIEPIATVDGTVLSGCAGGGNTPRNVGKVSYSTSRSSGTLKFTVSADDANQKAVKNGCASKAIKVFHGSSDEQLVDVSLSGPSDDPIKDCKPE